MAFMSIGFLLGRSMLFLARFIQHPTAAYEKTAYGAYSSLNSSQVHSFFLWWVWISIHKISITVFFYTEDFEPCPYLLNGGNFIMISFIFPQGGVQDLGCYRVWTGIEGWVSMASIETSIACPLSTLPIQITCYWSVSLEPGTRAPSVICMFGLVCHILEHTRDILWLQFSGMQLAFHE